MCARCNGINPTHLFLSFEGSLLLSHQSALHCRTFLTPCCISDTSNRLELQVYQYRLRCLSYCASVNQFQRVEKVLMRRPPKKGLACTLLSCTTPLRSPTQKLLLTISTDQGTEIIPSSKRRQQYLRKKRKVLTADFFLSHVSLVLVRSIWCRQPGMQQFGATDSWTRPLLYFSTVFPSSPPPRAVGWPRLILRCTLPGCSTTLQSRRLHR